MSENIIFRVDEKLSQQLRKRAKAEKVTLSELLRNIARAYLEPGDLREKVQEAKRREALQNIQASLTALGFLPSGKIEGLVSMKPGPGAIPT